MRREWLWAALLTCAWLLLATNARADDETQNARESQKLTWNPDWPAFRPAEYIATGVVGAASLGTFLFAKSPSTPHWTGGILFDDSARDAFRLRSPGARDFARQLSDYTAIGSVVLVVGVDSLLIPLLRKSDRVAFQLFLLDAEAFAFSSFITTSLYTYVGRARPSYADCQRDPNFDPLCNSGATASFPSGHSDAVFTAAGLSCAHHGHLPLYGGAGDIFACIGSLALATTTAGLRVAGDRHYMTDVLTSAGIGFGFGYGVPTLLHYANFWRNTAKAESGSLSITPLGGPSGYGLAAAGSF